MTPIAPKLRESQKLLIVNIDVMVCKVSMEIPCHFMWKDEAGTGGRAETGAGMQCCWEGTEGGLGGWGIILLHWLRGTERKFPSLLIIDTLEAWDSMPTFGTGITWAVNNINLRTSLREPTPRIHANINENRCIEPIHHTGVDLDSVKMENYVERTFFQKVTNCKSDIVNTCSIW